MSEIIFNSGDYATLLEEAKTLGFVDAEDNIITNGTFQSGGGWFLNLTGMVYEPVVPPTNPDDPWPAPVPRAGYWGRLRLNGTPDAMPTFSSAIVQYVWDQNIGPVDPVTGMHSGGWTDDGVTVAPEWVGQIGMIA